MEEFLLTREPLNIVRIFTALFVRVEYGEWTGVLEKEVENFENVLVQVLKQVPSEDIERIKKLQSFSTGKKLVKLAYILVNGAFEDLCSLTEMKALVIDAETWPDDINANLHFLKHDVEQVNIESLGFDHPICSGVLDIKSEPFTKMPGLFCDVFKEPFQKYKLDQNDMIMDICKEFIHNEKSKINVDDDLSNVEYGRWLDNSEKLQTMSKQILEALLKVWKSPKYNAYSKKGKPVNEGSYVCEVLAPLINIVMSDLPGNPVVWDIWPDYMTIVQLEKSVELEIVYLETGKPNSTQDK
ncbi:1962_t:CDS:2 [Acaulospora morrowiae]|uniref:1962_t:CDS:1 n=1 Tax=Acaulospora morrowiae TaxID=94023 RepID=A0A9N9BSG4_9GLOM|nr:1962_t:CDS:2 [Acaulospora morrowiae]